MDWRREFPPTNAGARHMNKYVTMALVALAVVIVKPYIPVIKDL